MEGISDQLVEEIQKILEGKLNTKDKKIGWDIKRYRLEDDFKSLWEIGSNKALKDKIIVIWDGFPNNPSNSPVSLEQFITPIDWALAYLIQCHNTNQSIPNIVILDLFSHNYNNYEKDMKEWHQNVLRKMKKWLQFYSFNIKTFKDAASSPLDIKDHLANQSVKNLTKDKPQGLSALSEKWFQNIKYIAEKARGNHSINNIMGSMVIKMLMDLEITGEYLYEKAFHQNFIWHGWIIPEEDKPDVLPPKIEIDDSTRIILIDDLGEYGWLDILSWWFLGRTSQSGTLPDLPGYKIRSNNNKKLYSTTDEGDYGYVSPIINKLEKEISEIEDSIKHNNPPESRYKSNFTGDPRKNEILFFDLYLFPKNTLKENQYFIKIWQLATYIKDNIDSQKILSEDVLDLIKNFGNDCPPAAQDFSNRYEDWLTLLPRLISLIDPTIPIILFSSSERPRIEDPLSSYKNIYRYRKPTPLSEKSQSSDNSSGLNMEQVKQDIQELIGNIESKLESLEVRNNLRNLSFYAYDNIKELCAFSNDGENTIEIMLAIDERNTPGINKEFTVGGWYGSEEIANMNLPGSNKQARRENWPKCVSDIIQSGIKIYAIKLSSKTCLTTSNRTIALIEAVKKLPAGPLNNNNFLEVLNRIIKNYKNNNNNNRGGLGSGSFPENVIKSIIEKSRMAGMKNFNVERFYSCFNKHFSDALNEKVLSKYIDPISEDFLNNVRLHHEMLSYLLELFLYVLVPAHKANSFNLSIHVATCHRPCFTAIAKGTDVDYVGGNYGHASFSNYKMYKVIKDGDLNIYYSHVKNLYPNNLVSQPGLQESRADTDTSLQKADCVLDNDNEGAYTEITEEMEGLKEYLQVNRTLCNKGDLVSDLEEITRGKKLKDIFKDDLTIVRRCIRKQLGRACYEISREDVYRVLYGA